MPAPAAADPKASPKPDTKQPRAWNVVLIDDDDHTYEYVIEMMGKLFAHGPERAYQIARAVDTAGRAVCLTTHKEHAELKRDQIHAYGRDARMARSAGSMSAVIEPAMGDDEPPDDAKDRPPP